MKNEDQANQGTAIPPSPLPINQIPRPSKINMILHNDDTNTSLVKQNQQEPLTTPTKLEESKVRIDKIDEESEVDDVAEETLALEEHRNQYESMRSAPNSNNKKRLSSLVSSTYHLQKLLDKKRPPGPPPLPPSPSTSDEEQDDSTFNNNSEQNNQTVKEDEQLMKQTQKQKYPSSVDIEKIRPSGPPPSSVIRDIAKLRQTLEAPQELRPDLNNNNNNVVKMKPHSIQRKSLTKKVDKAPTTTTNNDNNNLTAHTETRRKKIPPPGSLWIKCLNAENIRRKDQTSSKTNLNPYLSFKLLHQHDTTSIMKQKSKVRFNTGKDIDFQNEIIRFNLNKDLLKSLFIGGSGDSSDAPSGDESNNKYYYPKDNSPVLIIELWHDVSSEDNLDSTNSSYQDVLLGEATVQATRLFTPTSTFSHNTTNDKYESIPIQAPNDTSSNSLIQLQFEYHYVFQGMLAFTLYECLQLTMPSQLKEGGQTYVTLSTSSSDKNTTQSSEVTNSKSKNEKYYSPYFAQQELLIWIDDSNWFQDLMIQVWTTTTNNNNTSEDTPILIGQTNLSLFPYMKKSRLHNNKSASETKQEILPLQSNTNTPPSSSSSNTTTKAKIRTKIQFLQAGELNIQFTRAKYLRNVLLMMNDENHTIQASSTGAPTTTASTIMDPYVVFKCKGKTHTITDQTPPKKEGGQNPIWNYNSHQEHSSSSSYKIVDQYLFTLECYHHDPLFPSKGTLIGISKEQSLLPVFKYGRIQMSIPLEYKNEFDHVVNAGQVEVKMDFKGPRGIPYPQLAHHAQVDSFDDTYRRDEHEPYHDLDLGEEEDKNDRMAQEIVNKNNSTSNECGFTMDEIKKAFHFLDLDKNNYIGASEIRHLLICMGELVSDEEIDMMISMLDENGDGQISLDEFRYMIQHPDPSQDDFLQQKKNKENEKDGIILRKSGTGTGGIGGDSTSQAIVSTSPTKNNQVDLMDINQRTLELEKRNEKRTALLHFVTKYNLKSKDIYQMWESYKQQDSEKKSDKLSVDSFCKYLPIDKTGQTQHVFNLFDRDGSGFIQTREIILGLCNFIPLSDNDENSNNEKSPHINIIQRTDTKQRCQLIFEMFDYDRSGVLGLSEIELIMKGNHMHTNHSMIVKKAQTVMRSSSSSSGVDNKEGNGPTIDLEDFIVVAKKFPNLLFPNHLTQMKAQ